MLLILANGKHVFVAGFEVISRGFSLSIHDDQFKLELQFVVYDASNAALKVR